MKISEAKSKLRDDFFNFVEIRKNPAKKSEYIALLHCHNGKSFKLTYENNTILSSPDLEHVVLMLKDVGFIKAKLYF